MNSKCFTDSVKRFTDKVNGNIIDFFTVKNEDDFTRLSEMMGYKVEKSYTHSVAHDGQSRLFGFYISELDNVVFKGTFFESAIHMNNFYHNFVRFDDCNYVFEYGPDNEQLVEATSTGSWANSTGLVGGTTYATIYIKYNSSTGLFEVYNSVQEQIFTLKKSKLALYLNQVGATLDMSKYIGTTMRQTTNFLPVETNFKSLNALDPEVLLATIANAMPDQNVAYNIVLRDTPYVTDPVLPNHPGNPFFAEAVNRHLPSLKRNLGKSLLDKDTDPSYTELAAMIKAGQTGKLEKIVISTKSSEELAEDTNLNKHEVAFVFENSSYYPLPFKDDSAVALSNLNVLFRTNNMALDSEVLLDALNTPGIHHVKFVNDSTIMKTTKGQNKTSKSSV